MTDFDTRDTIRLTGLSARGYHGVLPVERQEGQVFVVDLVLGLAEPGVRQAAASDDLAQTVDYSALAGTVVRVVEGEPVNLIETLACRIADVVLAEDRVAVVEVTVHKPQAPLEVAFDDVAVTVRRERGEAVPAGSPDAAERAGGEGRRRGAHAAEAPVDGPEAGVVSGLAQLTPWWDPAPAEEVEVGVEAGEPLPAETGGGPAGAGGVEDTEDDGALAAGPVGAVAPDGAVEPVVGASSEDGQGADGTEGLPEVAVGAVLPAAGAAALVGESGVGGLAPAGEPTGEHVVEPAGEPKAAEPAGPEPVTASADEPEPGVLDQRPTAPVAAVIALGGNVGGVVSALRSAVHTLSVTDGVDVVQVAPLARTAAVVPEGGESQPDYLNTVVLVRTGLSPRELLDVCQRLETDAGRVRLTPKGPRTLDADLITYEGVRSDDPHLTLPHPEAARRAFVLVPWAQADPFAEIDEQSVAALAEQAPDREGVRWLALDWLDSDHLPALPTGQYVAPPSVEAAGAVPAQAAGQRPSDDASAQEPAGEQVPDAPADTSGSADASDAAAPVDVSDAAVQAPGEAPAEEMAAEQSARPQPDDDEPATSAPDLPDEESQQPTDGELQEEDRDAVVRPERPALSLPGDDREWSAPPSWGDVIGAGETDSSSSSR